MSDQRRPTPPKGSTSHPPMWMASIRWPNSHWTCVRRRTHSTDPECGRLLDPMLWEITHNPWVILQTVSRAKLQSMLAEPAFRKTIDDLVRKARREDAEAPAWFQQNSTRTHR